VGSRSTTVEARSGGQGVASSNLASPTVRHLVRVHFPGRGMYRQAVKGHRFQLIFRWSWQWVPSMRSGPCTLLGRAQMGADVDIHCVASGERHPLEPRPRDPSPRREYGGPGRDGSPLIWPLGSISGSCLSTAPAVQAFPMGPPVAAPSQLFPQGV
jgi:hypothetical protein